MGAVSGLLGTAGGVGGTGISGPNSATIINPADKQQADMAFNSTQQGLVNQQGFLGAIQAQNGLANQSNVFNQMQGVANGTGPNPAQAMLAQSTGANVANQAALMAGQRGTSQNAGLLARQAAMQGANIQQQAAGQGATMQANQSLSALNQLGGIAGQQVAQQANATNAFSQSAQGQQANVLGAINGQNSANVANQSSMNSANAGLAAETMKGNQNMIGNIAGGAGSALGLAKGGMIPRYAEGTDSVYQPIDPGSDPFASERMQFAPNTYVPAAPNAPNIMTPQGAAQLNAQAAQGPKSNVGKHFMDNKSGMGAAGAGIGYGLGKAIQGIGNLFHSAPQAPQAAPQGAADSPDVQAPAQAMPDDGSQVMAAARGGQVPALVSPGEQYLPPKDVKKVVKEGKSPLSVGERIPGKPKFPGNDYRNDVVKKTLETGGVVIPNEIMQSKNRDAEAHKFLADVLAKQGLPKKGK